MTLKVRATYSLNYNPLLVKQYRFIGYIKAETCIIVGTTYVKF